MKRKNTIKINLAPVIRIAASLGVFWLILNALPALSGSRPFSPDSWLIYDISKSIFSNFYNIHTIRQFQYLTTQGISYPPLYPLLIASVNHFFNMGIYTGYFLNIGFLVIIYLLLIRITTKLGEFLIAPIAFLLLLANQFFIEEVIAARSIPLTILLLLLSLTLVLYLPLKKVMTFMLLGTVSGLAALVRFEYLIVGLSCGVLFFLLFRVSLKKIVFYYLIFLLVISPWIFYSLKHFNKIFVSDNSRTVTSAEPIFVLDYFPPGTKVPTVFSQPAAWKKVAVNRFNMTRSGLIRSIRENKIPNSLYQILPAVFTILLLFHYRTKRKHFVIGWYLLFASLAYLIFLSIALTGYTDPRYFTIIHLFISILVTHGLLIISRPFGKMVSLTILSAIFFYLFFNLPAEYRKPFYFSPLSINSDNLYPNEYRTIITLLKKDSSNPVVLFSEGTGNYAKFPAITNLIGIYPPTNLNSCNFKALVYYWRPTHLYTTCQSWLDTLKKDVKIEITPLPLLFKLSYGHWQYLPQPCPLKSESAFSACKSDYIPKP